MEIQTPPAKNVVKSDTRVMGVIAVDPALTQAVAETVGKKLNKPPEKVTVEEAKGELQKTADQMASS